MSIYWSTLITGLALIVNSFLTLPDEGIYWGFPIPVWAEWVLLFIGMLMVLIGFSYIRCGKGKYKPPVYTDEDAQQAKADLERMYLRDHGELPKPPKDEK